MSDLDSILKRTHAFKRKRTALKLRSTHANIEEPVHEHMKGAPHPTGSRSKRNREQPQMFKIKEETVALGR